MIASDTLLGNAAISDAMDILHDIHMKTKNIVVYQRGIPSLKRELDDDLTSRMEWRGSGTVEEIGLSLNRYFAKEFPSQLELRKDVLNLLGLFEKVTKVSSFRISLVTVNTNMCRRFHADNNELRMLCTYYGAGTLWLPNEAVDRQAYLTGKANRNILIDESHVQQVNTGDVVLLKGSLYPESTPILHRSPNIEENGERRILLSIDANEAINW